MTAAAPVRILRNRRSIIASTGSGGRTIDASKRAPQTIDEYIAGFPEDVQLVLRTLRDAIRDFAPQATEKISYQMPTFVLDGPFVYFGAWKKHVGFYPISTAMEEQIPGLRDYKTTGKGTVQFPYSKPLPLDLIRTILTFRLEEMAAETPA